MWYFRVMYSKIRIGINNIKIYGMMIIIIMTMSRIVRIYYNKIKVMRVLKVL